MNKRTLVLGASENTGRYSNKAINNLRTKKIEVFAIGSKKGAVLDVEIGTEKQLFEDIHTVTMYLNSANQKEYYNYIIQLHPKRVIFNPGAENLELKRLLEEQHIETKEDCTLVLLSIGQY